MTTLPAKMSDLRREFPDQFEVTVAVRRYGLVVGDWFVYARRSDVLPMVEVVDYRETREGGHWATLKLPLDIGVLRPPPEHVAQSAANRDKWNAFFKVGPPSDRNKE